MVGVWCDYYYRVEAQLIVKYFTNLNLEIMINHKIMIIWSKNHHLVLWSLENLMVYENLYY